MAETTTFLARNNRRVTVHAPLWLAAQALTRAATGGRLLPGDALRLLAQVDLTPGALDLEKRTLRHIRWYFRWSEDGGKALLSGLRRAGQWHWTEEGLTQTLLELTAQFDIPGPLPPLGPPEAHTSGDAQPGGSRPEGASAPPDSADTREGAHPLPGAHGAPAERPSLF